MCMQNFITIFFTVLQIRPFSLFQNLKLGKASQIKNVISQSLGLNLVNIDVYATVYQNIPLSLIRDMAIFTFFSIWRSAKPRPMINVILQFLELDLVNINVSAKFYQNIPNGLRVKFHCFRIWTWANPWPIPNVSWLSHGLHHVNINVYAKFHHNIPLISRDMAIFTFSEFGARQSLDRRKMSFRNLLG